MYDPALCRWLVPDPAAQFANPYLAMGNNPVVGVDPDGRFAVWDSWVTGFWGGFFSTSDNRLSAGWESANRKAGNDLKIWGGLFITDPNNENGFQDAGEIFSRFTWQLPQTIGGFGTAQFFNSVGKGNYVKYKYGTTVVNADAIGKSKKDDRWGGVTQGSFIVGDTSIEADANNSLFQHEYGHYLQSQEMGWGYYNRVGIPSARSPEYRHTEHPVEQDANRRAFLYFNKNVSGFYTSPEGFYDYNRTTGWNFQDNPLGLNIEGIQWGDYWDYNDASQIEILNRYSTVKAKWFDYMFWYPFIGVLNSIIYNKSLE